MMRSIPSLAVVLLVAFVSAALANLAGDPLCPERPVDPEDKVIDSAVEPAVETQTTIDNEWIYGEAARVEEPIVNGPAVGDSFFWVREIKEGAYFAEDPAEGFVIPLVVEQPVGTMAVSISLPPMPWFAEADADAGWGLELYYYIGEPETTCELVVRRGTGELISYGGLVTAMHHSEPILAADLEDGLSLLFEFADFETEPGQPLFIALGVLTGNSGYPLELIDELGLEFGVTTGG
ncbi:MAG: hypothetical protein GF403_11740 [Candidatus Coatesbacteria bacterium]|nr:hypothetical protein [Candidatus Coatesbacteria bacterium]